MSTTAPQSTTAQTGNRQTAAIDFYFDPSCPWAWRASVWIREVARVRPIDITWKFLSLAEINREDDYAAESHAQSHATFRLLLRARDEGGNEAVDRLYEALGRAKHEMKESLGDPDVLKRALTEANLDPAWLDAGAPANWEERVLAEHRDGVERVKAFGVPTISVEGSKGFYGPVIGSVPTGEYAGEMWDHVVWLSRQPDFFEYKRSRK